MWFSSVEKHASKDALKILIGNKCDWKENRAVSTEQGQKLADELGIPFLEVSAKSNIKVDEAFYSLATNITEVSDKLRGEQVAAQEVSMDQHRAGQVSSLRDRCC
jgi:Ras-related protein Rab-8A